jgi:hypothetical protein
MSGMTPSSLRIVVTGYIGQYPLGGMAWEYLQYFLGLQRLGHDVYYIEDTNQWPYNPEEVGLAENVEYNVRYLSQLFDRFEAGDRWGFRFFWDDTWFGLGESRVHDLFRSADLVLNISGSLGNLEFPRHHAVWGYLDTDPVFTQVKIAAGNSTLVDHVNAHDVHFTFGETLSSAVPDTGHRWNPTRVPIVLPEWEPVDDAGPSFTTVMNWTSYKSLEFEGVTYGQKDVEFRKYLDLPELARTDFELAVNEGKTSRLPRELLAHKGWRVVDPHVVCPDLDSYRNYIRSSRAEWSVAKGGYVTGRAGWFSMRSASYLASARPVVVQDTGFSRILPVGEGLIAFATLDEAVAGVGEVMAHPRRHSTAARSVAEEYFDADRVLSTLVGTAMNSEFHSRNVHDTAGE